MAVKKLAMTVNTSRMRFLVCEESASAPRMGEVSPTMSMAMPTDSPHSREPSAPPTTVPLK